MNSTTFLIHVRKDALARFAPTQAYTKNRPLKERAPE